MFEKGSGWTHTRLSPVARAFGVALVLASCSGEPKEQGTEACSAIACNDGFLATVMLNSASIPAGHHTIEVTADQSAFSCAIDFPPVSSNGAIGSGECSSGISLTIQPATVCHSSSSANATTLTCDQVPGQYLEQIGIAGTPASVDVKQMVNGMAILTGTASPTYQSVQPNGPGCPGSCLEGTAQWTP